MDNVFNEEEIEKKIFDDRWVKFAFGAHGKVNTEDLNLGITRFEEGKTSLTHQHDVDEALYIMSGKGTIRLGEALKSVEEGDFIYVPRNTDHTMITDRGAGLKIFFVFSGRVVIDH